MPCRRLLRARRGAAAGSAAARGTAAGDAAVAGVAAGAAAGAAAAIIVHSQQQDLCENNYTRAIKKESTKKKKSKQLQHKLSQ